MTAGLEKGGTSKSTSKEHRPSDGKSSVVNQCSKYPTLKFFAKPLHDDDLQLTTALPMLLDPLLQFGEISMSGTQMQLNHC